MIQLRPARERGHFDHGWLDTWHTFSFGDYLDPAHVQFRALRVMNEDRVHPGQGFGMHGHRNMEIVTYILSGELEHQDSLGNGEVLREGELQRMTAGSGIRHSEFNPSSTQPVHLYQVWLLPRAKELPPSYEQRTFSKAEQQGKLRLVVSPDGQDDSLVIQQNARIYLASLGKGQSVTQPIDTGRAAWLQILRGSLTLAEYTLSAGDGAAITDLREVTLTANEPTEIMWFDFE